MAKFLNTLEVRCLADGRQWTLLKELQFATDDGRVIYVPAGFITDFASVPKFFRRLFQPATGKYRRSAVPHDWIYRTPDVAISKEDADIFFLQGMIIDDTPKWKRTLLYAAVRAFGDSSYVPRTPEAKFAINLAAANVRR
jgi:hypothetical protein